MPVLLALLILLCTPPALLAQNPAPTPDIPETLRPWTGWVLHGHAAERCPLVHGSDGRQCAWPSRLKLDIDDNGGRFSQSWQMDAAQWVPLPGDDRLWPQDARVDGESLVVMAREARPHVYLDAGRHKVTGAFVWDNPPQVLAVPNATGILTLIVRGEPVPFPERDEEGRLWLQRRATPEEKSWMDIAVHRRVVDKIPLLLETRIELKVSGERREEILGRPLPEGFVPMSLESALPARLEADGHLRVQVRPGTWTIELVARHDGPAAAISLREPDGPWDAQEIWTFAARNDLRVVGIEGLTPVDPQQTELPDEWRQLPAYVLKPGDTMRLVEKQRGDTDPSPDSLSLSRTWWLDFDGGGFTIHDEITGTMNRGWRLVMDPPARLGRAAVGGKDQLITELNGAGQGGIEIRQADVRVDADSRLEEPSATIAAVGWAHDFQSVSGNLNLGPGWTLLHATGVDRASPTWISSWTLFDFFVVLLVAMGVSRLRGRAWGAFALVALALTYIEADAPQAAWVAVLVAEALIVALPPGRWSSGVRLMRLAAVGALLLVAVPFMVQRARQAVHPALAEVVTMPVAPPPFFPQAMRDKADEPAQPELLAKGVVPPTPSPKSRALWRSYAYEADPNANVQTGPGLPNWQWQRVSMQWSGPVEASQQLRLVLLPPWMNRVLDGLRVLFTGLLLLCVLRRLPLAATSKALAAAGLAFLFTAVPPPASAELPDAALLEQLRQRLLEDPPCTPDCASSPELRLEADATVLRLRMRIDAAADVAVPLPGGASQWVPETVLLDGTDAAALMRADSTVWIRVPAGQHDVLLQGPLPSRDEVQIHLPMKPHLVRATAQGWKVDGLHEDGLADDDLVLTRVRTAEDADAGVLEPGTLPPFVRVLRVLPLGLTWQVQTSIERLTPPGTATVLEVPLLPGESVTTPGVRVVADKVLVNLGATDTHFEWESVLAQTQALQLVATESQSRVEVWQVDASPLWHVEATGIPTVRATSTSERRVQQWQPWPGERVDLVIERPPPLPGRTITVDAASLTITPGLRATDVVADVSIRSSRGGDHAVTLPATADLQSVSINGAEQPIRQNRQLITLPLVPGVQTVQIKWRQPEGTGARLVSPAFDVGAPSVNAFILIEMPADRWTLFCWGPELGPTVLFWGVVIVFLGVSIALGRRRMTPLRWYEWFLLSLGLTQAHIVITLVVVGWLFLLGWRRDHGAGRSTVAFNGLQLLIVLSTIAALAGLFYSVQQGLLGVPEMQIAGNGSTSRFLRWYEDISDNVLPQVSVFSVPLYVYRIAMLLWALWLARALLGWLRWGWEGFSIGGLWQPVRWATEPQPPPPTQ